ncbi:hypothetical protein ASE70_18730 [Sphingomonas sp. Leaf22]|uniref:hypothetical protein n=1 Tax=Sphingomonas sp. Leaf22 TaxID=1735687 RepID=UPI0006F7E464|nr:hypothetical protein [Sphingomonas sp. Leaf22]KQM79616.1 hypothetical protein ASE70_18730 [Sphingomonas sp. Leaf22]
MNFVQWLNSLDKLLYELMSWLVFFPVTLWRIVRHPLQTMAYAEDQLRQPADRQFRGTVNPPITMILTLVLSQAIDLSVHDVNPIVASQHGLARLVNDNTTLLSLRLILFGAFPLALATRKVRRSNVQLDRDSLQGPFYAQCFAVAPFSLGISVGSTLAAQSIAVAQYVGALIFAVACAFYILVETRWFHTELRQSYWRSASHTFISTLEAGLFALCFSLLFAL